MLISILFVGCNSSEETKDMISTKGIITEVALNTNSGKTIKAIKANDGFKFSGYEGKAVLLGFFATWCPPCKAEIPHLVDLSTKYKDKFAVIAVLIENDKPKEELNGFVSEHKINYEIALSPSNEEMAKAVGGVRGVPNMFLYAADGRMIAHYPGAVPQEMIEDDLRKAGVIK
jgi:thiol-disulfide isomerase/thioredoxin